MLICLPETLEGLDVRAELAREPLPDGADLVFWDGSGDPPRREEITFLVPMGTALGRMPLLEVVQTLSAGVDWIIAAVPEGVTLCDARGVHGAAVAEWALAVTLLTLRDLAGFVRAQDARRWTSSVTGELAGRRVLIVGAGDAGEQAARRFAACDTEPTLVARSSRAGVHAREELPRLLPRADVVVVVVPLTPATTGMVDRAFLAAMPDGALLVNGARGAVVDTDALLVELTEGRLRAVLDVTDPEPLPPDHPLWQAPGLVLTPHVAGRVAGFPPRALALVRSQVRRHMAGEPLENVVAEGY